jgi:DNA-binding transcriptional LysR family regulator
MLSEIETVQLRRFVAIVECGGFAEAARQLNISQQALSASIARLEDMAGVKFLARRRGTRIELTPEGRFLMARAYTHLAMADRLMSEIGLMRGARGGMVAIGAGETMVGRQVAEAIRSYHKQNPDVQIHLVEGYTEALIERLLTGDLDFVVGGPSYDRGDSDVLDTQFLFEINDVLAVRRGHPLTKLAKVSLSDLSKYTWIIPAYRGDVFKAMQAAYFNAGISAPKRIIRSDAVVLGTWLCLDDDYVVSVSPDMISAWLTHGAMVTLTNADIALTRSACVITRRNARLSPHADRLMQTIVIETQRDRTQVVASKSKESSR